MIMADSFVKSHKARECEFSTNSSDRPLVVQFAANNVEDFLSASNMIARYEIYIYFFAYFEKKSISLMDQRLIFQDK